MRTTLTTFAALAIAATAFTAVPMAASAATQCKPTVSAKGMFYTTKSKARSSAGYRWGLKAASKYGSSFAHVGQAKAKSYKCTSGHGAGGNLFNCKLTAKPCKTVSVCKGRVKAKGQLYKTQSKAVSSAQYRWGLRSASKYGASFGHWGKAKGKSMKCSGGHGSSGKLIRCTASAKACK